MNKILFKTPLKPLGGQVLLGKRWGLALGDNGLGLDSKKKRPWQSLYVHSVPFGSDPNR